MFVSAVSKVIGSRSGQSDAIWSSALSDGLHSSCTSACQTPQPHTQSPSSPSAWTATASKQHPSTNLSVDSVISGLWRKTVCSQGKKMTKGLIPSSRPVSIFPQVLSRSLHTCQPALGDRAEIWGLTCSPIVLPSDPLEVLADWHCLTSAKKQQQGNTQL